MNDAPEPATLPDLLRRAGAGEPAALDELLRRYERRVRLAARALLKPQLRHVLDSLDLVQSVHRALLPGLRGGRYACETEDQLIGLAVVVLRRKVARVARQPLVQASAPTPADSPADLAEANDRLAHLLGGLGEDDRRIVEMRVRGCDTAEIAAAAGCTPAVLRARLSRLRQRLRDAGLADGEL